MAYSGTESPNTKAKYSIAHETTFSTIDTKESFSTTKIFFRKVDLSELLNVENGEILAKIKAEMQNCDKVFVKKDVVLRSGNPVLERFLEKKKPPSGSRPYGRTDVVGILFIFLIDIAPYRMVRSDRKF